MLSHTKMVVSTVAVIILNMITATVPTLTQIKCQIHKYQGIFYTSDILLKLNERYELAPSIFDCAGYCVDVKLICKGVTYDTNSNSCKLHGSSLGSKLPGQKYKEKPEMVHASIRCAVVGSSQHLSSTDAKAFNQSQKTPMTPSGRNKPQTAKPSDNILRPQPSPKKVASSNPTKNSKSPPSSVNWQPKSSEYSIRFTDIGSTYFSVELTSAAERVDGYSLRYQKPNDGSSSMWRPFARDSLNRNVYIANVAGLMVDTSYEVSFYATINRRDVLLGSKLIKTLCGKPIQSPENVLASMQSPNTIRLQWAAPPSSTWECSRIGYVIRYRNSSEFSEIDVDGDQTSYNFHTEPNRLWEFYVSTQAINGNGNKGEFSFWSKYVEFISTDFSSGYEDVPIAPQVVIADVGPTSVEIEWHSVIDDVRGYIVIYRNVNDARYKQSGEMIWQFYNSRKISKTLSDLEFDETYSIQIIVIDRSNRLGLPNLESKAHTACKTPTSPPDNIIIKFAPDSQLKLIWKAPPPDTGLCSNNSYEIEFCNSFSNLHYIELPFETTEHTFLPSPEAEWTSIRMRTINKEGHSSWTEVVAIPGPVKDLTIAPAGPDAINASWGILVSPTTAIVSYIVKYTMTSVSDCPIAQNKQRVMDKITKLNSVNLVDLAAWSTYKITVNAVFGEIQGPDSKPITIQTERSVASGPPINVKVTFLSETQANVTWDKPACLDRNGPIDKYQYALKDLRSYGSQYDHWETVQAQSVLLPLLSSSVVHYLMLRTARSFCHESIEFFKKTPTFGSPGEFKTQMVTPNEITISFLPSTPPEGTTLSIYHIRYKVVGYQHNWHEVTKMTNESDCPALGISDGRFCIEAKELEPNSYYIFQVQSVATPGVIRSWSDYYYQSTSEPDIRIPLTSPITVLTRQQRSVSLYWRQFDEKKVKFWDILYNVEGTVEWITARNITKEYVDFGRVKYQVPNLREGTTYFFRFRVKLDGDTSTLSRSAKGQTTCGIPTEPPEITNVTVHEFYTVRLTWKAPDKSTWKCWDVGYIIECTTPTKKYQHRIYSNSITSMDFKSKLNVRWEFRMQMAAMEGLYFKKGSRSVWTRSVIIRTKRPQIAYGYSDSCNVILYNNVAYTNSVPFETSTGDGNWSFCRDNCIRQQPSNNCAGINFIQQSNLCEYFTTSITNIDDAKGTFEAREGVKHASINCDNHGTTDDLFSCGKQAPKYKPVLPTKHRIIGGTTAKLHSWPWQTRLYNTSLDSRKGKCGASLIYPRYDNIAIQESDIVLTAAHCVENYTQTTALSLSIWAGGHDTDLAFNSQGEIRSVIAIAMHEHYTEDSDGTPVNDIALLKLSTPISFSDTIRPICLPEQNAPIPLGKTCMAAGWGRDHAFFKSRPKKLQQTLLLIVSSGECQSSFPSGSTYHESEMLCVGPMDGSTGACSGDSGGMLGCQEHDGSWTLHGVTSFLPSACVTPGVPDVFVRVSSYVTWIKEKAKSMTSL